MIRKDNLRHSLDGKYLFGPPLADIGKTLQLGLYTMSAAVGLYALLRSVLLRSCSLRSLRQCV